MGWNMDKEDLKDIIEKNKDELFSEIAQEINNDNVTDIEWDLCFTDQLFQMSNNF